MARTQARVLVSIWSDESDFKYLTPSAQRMYLFLLSQPNLNHAGLLPLTVKRWARSAEGLTAETVTADLMMLEEQEYVVLDLETEELLIRTLVRNDGVWKQPKVMLAMKADAAEIMSPLLRYKLRDELLRIDTSSLEKVEQRAAVDKAMAEVIDTLPDTPPMGYRIPHAEGSGYPHACAGARSSASASASTTTSTTAIAPAKPTRERDEIWDTLLEVCNIDPTNVPNSARGAYNRAVKDLRAVNATPSEIRRRAAIYRGQWRDVSLTPTALVRRWSECDRPQPLAVAPDRFASAMQRAEAAEAQPPRKALP